MDEVPNNQGIDTDRRAAERVETTLCQTKTKPALTVTVRRGSAAVREDGEEPWRLRFFSEPNCQSFYFLECVN